LRDFLVQLEQWVCWGLSGSGLQFNIVFLSTTIIHHLIGYFPTVLLTSSSLRFPLLLLVLLIVLLDLLHALLILAVLIHLRLRPPDHSPILLGLHDLRLNGILLFQPATDWGLLDRLDGLVRQLLSVDVEATLGRPAFLAEEEVQHAVVAVRQWQWGV
jgi:hypothetical protein